MTERPEEARWGLFPTGGPSALGTTIAAIRRNTTSLTQEELGNRAHVHRARVGVLERGESTNPNLTTLVRVARGLDVSVSVLVAAFIWPPSSDLPFERWADGSTPAGPTRSRMSATPPPSVIGSAALGLTLQSFRALNGQATYRRLAEAAGMATGWIIKLEHGEVANPGLLTIARLAHALNGNVVDLGLLDLSVSLLAQVFAGEVSAHTAIRRRRAWDERRYFGERGKGDPMTAGKVQDT